MRRIAAGVVGLLWLLAPLWGEEKKGAETPRAPEPIRYAPAREIAKLADPEITESSGIACSRVSEGVFWTHNDAGNPARLYAFNRDGKSLGTFVVSGAESHDWEDIASFKRGKAGFLLVADVGDNYRQRRDYALYLIAEPAELRNPERSERVLRAPVKSPATLKTLMKVRFAYEDGAHNCESMGFDAT